MVDVEKLQLNFGKGAGLVTAIMQDCKTNQVLMCAFMSKDALNKTLETGKIHVWSRSQQRLRMKGEISGHVQLVKEAYVDCDRDAIVFKVEQVNAACHFGYKSCFFSKLKNGDWKIVEEKVFEPKDVYGE